jgi:4-hydroxybenzoate polyprenyltransferase
MTAMRVCSFLWTLLWLVWLVAWLRIKRTQECVDFGSRLLYGLPVFFAFYLVFSESFPFGWLRARILPQNIFLETLAVSLTALGIGFAIWARSTSDKTGAAP